MGKVSIVSKLVAVLLTSTMLAVAIPPPAGATISDPDYTRPLLDPATQQPAPGVPWTNGPIPNALMAAFTYTPYTAGSPGANAFAAVDPSATCGVNEDCYTVSVRQVAQQLGLVDEISGAPLTTTVWGYGSSTNAPAVGPFTAGVWHAPAPTFKNTSNRPTRITWVNQLPNVQQPGFDPTYCNGSPATDCYPYNRIVTHVHGAHTLGDSDGYPEAWYTPGFTKTGATYSPSIYGPLGTYRYPNTQEAGTIWYHDHATGVTHLNTQMGMAGFYLITDDNEKCLQGTVIGGVCPAPTKVLPTDPYEVGFALQDRTFWPDGSIAMPDQPIRDLTSPSCAPDLINGGIIPTTCPTVPFSKAPDGHLIPYDGTLADTSLRGPYTANNGTLEYFGNMPMVNGVVYGTYDIEPRVYRMRFIGGTDSRTWVMRLKNRRTGAVIPFWQIGSEQGLLANPVQRTTIDLMPGERIDVLVNFQDNPAGSIQLGDKIVLENFGPDTPYAGPDIFQGVVNPLTQSAVIPEIMEFNVIALSGTPDVPAPTALVNLRQYTNAISTLTPTAPVRNVSLMEITDALGRTMPTIDSRGFMDMGVPITENVKFNDVEEWHIINTTMDAHPMHLHLVAFQLIERVQFNGFTPPVSDPMTGTFTPPSYTTAALVPGTNQIAPELWEAGWKDTIDCPPGWVTKVRAKFDIEGLYVWHCHILSHEEHDMMRSLRVVSPTKLAVFDAGTWYQDASGNQAWDGTPTDKNSAFGYAGVIPVSGDWSNTGTSKVGVYDPNTFAWYLDINNNGAWDGSPADKNYSFGFAGVSPVTGKWTGGATKIGVYDPATFKWYLDADGNGAWDGAKDYLYTCGTTGAIPVTGDWNGNGRTKIGYYDPSNSTWHLDYDGDGVCDTPTDKQSSFGFAGVTPVTGDWDGNGTTKIGVYDSANAVWYLDLNGNGYWDGTPTDANAFYGFGTAVPVTGNW